MCFFETSIPFLKVLAAFAAMLAGIRLRLPLSLSILCGGVLLGLFFGVGPVLIVQACGQALVEKNFLFLAAIVGLILILSDALERSGQSKRLMDALSGYLIRPRVRLVFFPALIGLLPMPGGAIFSAPLTDAASREMDMDNTQRTLINYWFRHIWELAWPLYPGFILIVALADIPITTFISRTWPAVFIMLGIGWLFFLRPGILRVQRQEGGVIVKKRNMSQVLVQGLPLILAITGSVGLECLIPIFAPELSFELGVIAALVVSIVCIMLQNRLGWEFTRQVLSKKSLYSMLLVIAAIFMFKEVMHAAEVVEAMAEAAGEDAALLAAAVFLPFLVGVVSGITVAFVGSTFPLLLGIIDTLGMAEAKIPFLVLASFAGFTGVLVSPLHICFILTCRFFKVEVSRAWRKLVLPSLLFAACGFLLFAFLLMF